MLVMLESKVGMGIDVDKRDAKEKHVMGLGAKIIPRWPCYGQHDHRLVEFEVEELFWWGSAKSSSI